MPSLEELEHRIIEQCSEPDGILTLIRNEQFDEAKYRKLVETLAAYRDGLGNQIQLSRKLAGWLRTIENTFHIAATADNKSVGIAKVDRRIKDAHPRILELMNGNDGILGMTYNYEHFDKFHDSDALTAEDNITTLDRLDYQLIEWSMEEEEMTRGLWIILHDLAYNDEKYHDFIKRLEDYLQVLGQAKRINRQVASYFLLVESQYLGAVIVYNRDKLPYMDSRIKAGYPKFAALLDKIFDVT